MQNGCEGDAKMIYNNDKLIAAAYIKARAEIGGTVGKDAKGNYGRYATLAAITDAITLPLSKHGLAIIQEATLDSDGVTVETTLLHESGATMQFAPLTMPLTDRKPQAVGSAITYGRRYALAAVCGLAPDDDDGQAAQDATKSAHKAVDNPFDKPMADVASKAQLTQLGDLGGAFYGAEWPDQLPKLVEAVTKGATSDAGQLQPAECAKLIAGIQRKMAQANGEVTGK